jgi:arylsulfatase A-like enzyme
MTKQIPGFKSQMRVVRSAREPHPLRVRRRGARCWVFLWTLVIGFGSFTAFAAASQPNVLVIAVDDLNHWVGHLGRNKQVKTPNIDRLAARGITFTRAYCAAPVCNPSRTALLSGLRPSTSGVYDNPTPWQPNVPRGYTLNEHFRASGYFVCGAGKIYHGGGGRRQDWNDYGTGGGGDPQPRGTNTGVGGIKFAPLDWRDEEMSDYRIATYGVEQLRKRYDKPFFLAIGFHKPHMPWNVPRKYYDMYPLEKIELPPYREDDLDDIPPAGVEMAKALGDHEAMLKSGRWKEAVQAYLAAISFMDAQVGRVLDALDRSAYATNTIICFWGDHGWHLGEKHHWRKFALWEEATRAPFIWVAPGITRPGSRCERTVDFMSIYPTLCELTGLAVPKHIEGMSIGKLLSDPAAEWKTPALTTHGYQNHAVRTERWRYIRYADGGEELYDHAKDPYEWSNLANDSEFSKTKTELGQQLPRINKAAPRHDRQGGASARPARNQSGARDVPARSGSASDASLE